MRGLGLNRLLPLSVALFACAATVRADVPVVKQLAGPPSEFAQMSLPDPREAAIQSTTALLPVQLTPARDGGWEWQTKVGLDGEHPSLVVFSGDDASWRTSVALSPGRAPIEAGALAAESGPSEYGISNETYLGMVYRFSEQQQEPWSVHIRSDMPSQEQGFVLVGSDSPWQLVSWQRDRNQWVGQRLEFFGVSEHRHERMLGAQIDHATLRVIAPDGRSVDHPMSPMASKALGDDRQAPFSGAFVPEFAGDYVVQVQVQGRTPDGSPFLRTAEHLVPVIDNPLTFGGSSAAVGRSIDEHRIAIDLGVASRQHQGYVRAHAQVWGHIGRELVPVAWIGGMVSAANPTLSLDSRWIGLSGAQAPFELRELRLEDAAHFIPLVRQSRIALDLGELPASAMRAPDEIDESMRMGPRPEGLGTGARSGPRLLLVHGYCSGDAWGPVLGQFSSATRFLDLNQNRTHDQFAQRIRNFGQQFSSFGIVAHSQGGAASTHLYTYYWSGLDSATGARLIQSVGTPYQGTPLAGNLAAIGSVFGAGCGSNSNLTTSGASAWLSGIPSWARAKVNYHTTSFATAWWRYDYCSLATDLFLSDPEDGVVERSRGQLSGAVNRGHKTGWCHTTEMRDPGQVRDSSRNATMSSTAAR